MNVVKDLIDGIVIQNKIEIDYKKLIVRGWL